MDYKEAGVDVEAGRAFVEKIRQNVESTFRPEVIGGLGGFGAAATGRPEKRQHKEGEVTEGFHGLVSFRGLF